MEIVDIYKICECGGKMFETIGISDDGIKAKNLNGVEMKCDECSRVAYLVVEVAEED